MEVHSSGLGVGIFRILLDCCRHLASFLRNGTRDDLMLLRLTLPDHLWNSCCGLLLLLGQLGNLLVHINCLFFSYTLHMGVQVLHADDRSADLLRK